MPTSFILDARDPYLSVPQKTLSVLGLYVTVTSAGLCFPQAQLSIKCAHWPAHSEALSLKEHF